MNLLALRDEVQQALQAAGIADDTKASALMAAALQCDRADMLLDRPMNDAEIARVREVLARRVNHEPLDRILGQREFYGLVFGLNSATLSPRADTETLVDEALGYKPQRILDIGTGTGCVVLALLAHLPQATAVATDINPQALQQAQLNAAALNLADRVSFVHTNFAEGIAGTFDVIVSNPPYIPSADVGQLEPEVKNYDPRLALDGGADGLNAYRAIFDAAPRLLHSKGVLLLEIGIQQAESVKELAEARGWQLRLEKPDLAGIPRVLSFFR